MDLTIKGKLVAKKSGIVTLLVFEDLTSEKFIMCTVLNDWDVGYIPKNSEGYLTYEEAKAAMEKKDQQREETENKDDKEDVHPLPDDHKNIDDIPLNPPSEKKNSDEHNSDENKDK